MSRPIRLEFPGALFHITSRGNERRRTFVDDADRIRYLELLGAAVNRFEWILTAYVLMSNHVHLVLELTAANLSRGMQWLHSKYSQQFNRRHNRVGHLFQSRPKELLIEKEAYLVTLLRYVVLNPVRAGMVTHPGDYKWSSYRATAGLDPAPKWLATDDALASFGDDRTAARARYQAYVNEGVGSESCPWRELVGQIYLGSEKWCQETRDRLKLRLRPDEHPRIQRHVGNRNMADVVSAVARVFETEPEWVRGGHGGAARMVAAWLGRYEAELTLSQIGAALRIRSGGYVSRLIGECDDGVQYDAGLRESLERAIGELHSLWNSDEGKA